MTHNPRPALAATFTALCLAALGALGWAAAGPAGLLLPALVAITGFQLPNNRRTHPSRTGLVLWQTLPLTAVGLLPFLICALAGWPVSTALAPAMAAVLALSLPLGKCREHAYPLPLVLVSCAALAMVVWVMAVGLTSSVTPRFFAQWRPFVDAYGPWMFAAGFLSFAGLMPLLTIGERHHTSQMSRQEIVRWLVLGAGYGGVSGLVLGLTDPFPNPAPVVLWTVCGVATGMTVAAVDALRQTWLLAMTWVLPKVPLADLERARIETAIALGDALAAANAQFPDWELVWRRDYDRYYTEYGHPLRFEINRHGGSWGPTPDEANKVLDDAYARLDATFGDHTQTHDDTGVTPIAALSAHAKMAALARVSGVQRTAI